MYPVFYVPAGDVLPIFFDTFAGATGASITLTGLAVTDIEIYKDGSVTQRASDAGYVLLDTDGIDFDGTTGIHGFSVDTGNNTDAGFYTVERWLHVVLASVTIDSQTVNKVVAAFRIMPAEDVAGHPKVDVGAISGDSTSADNAELYFDGTGYANANNSIGTVTGAVGSVVGNVGGNVVGSVGSIATNGVTAASLAADAGLEIADAVWDEVVDGATTGRESMRLHNAALGGKASGLSTATATYRDIADSKDRIVASVDADGNRSAVTRDLT